MAVRITKRGKEKYCKEELDALGIRYFCNGDMANEAIANALDVANLAKKSNGEIRNYPSIHFVLNENSCNPILVVIEAAGGTDFLEIRDKQNIIRSVIPFQHRSNGKGENREKTESYIYIKKYAVNGALYYANAIMENSEYKRAIIIGVGEITVNDNTGTRTETHCKAYYISNEDNYAPPLIDQICRPNGWELLKEENVDALGKYLCGFDYSEAKLKSRIAEEPSESENKELCATNPENERKNVIEAESASESLTFELENNEPEDKAQNVENNEGAFLENATSAEEENATAEEEPAIEAIPIEEAILNEEEPTTTREKITQLDFSNLTDKEIEIALESGIKKIHQAIYDNTEIGTSLTTNEKLYLFFGVIVAGLETPDIKPIQVSSLSLKNTESENDGIIILNQVKKFFAIAKKNCSNEKTNMILKLISPVFNKKSLWYVTDNQSIIKYLYTQVSSDIIPYLNARKDLHIDFASKILNALSDWADIDNDEKNDVVLTPRYVTNLMAKLARVNKDSYVWDNAAGSAGFLISAMDVMVQDAKNKINDEKKLANKIKRIKEKQLLGVELLSNIYMLAVLNMILMGDGSSNIINADSHEYHLDDTFPANVFLLNPPYSAPGRGLIFVKEALDQMKTGYACVLIQDSAGNGQGQPFAKQILENNTLLASIKMPLNLFAGKASVGTSIYLFKVGIPHNEKSIVTFVDFTEDGYTRQGRKKASQNINLKDTDNAEERYAELEAIILGKKIKAKYYIKENGKVIKDTISLDGDDWNFSSHQKFDIMPTLDDFKQTIANYMSFKITQLIQKTL